MASSTGTGAMDVIHCPRVLEPGPGSRDQYARIIFAERLAGLYSSSGYHGSSVTFTGVHERDTGHSAPKDEETTKQPETKTDVKERHLHVVPPISEVA